MHFNQIHSILSSSYCWLIVLFSVEFGLLFEGCSSMQVSTNNLTNVANSTSTDNKKDIYVTLCITFGVICFLQTIIIIMLSLLLHRTCQQLIRYKKMMISLIGTSEFSKMKESAKFCDLFHESDIPTKRFDIKMLNKIGETDFAKSFFNHGSDSETLKKTTYPTNNSHRRRMRASRDRKIQQIRMVHDRRDKRQRQTVKSKQNSKLIKSKSGTKSTKVVSPSQSIADPNCKPIFQANPECPSKHQADLDNITKTCSTNDNSLPNKSNELNAIETSVDTEITISNINSSIELNPKSKNLSSYRN